jgi:hypothetical protein
VVGGTIFTKFSILLRDLRRATMLEAKVSVFDLGPRSTVQSQLHDFWVRIIVLVFLSGSVAKMRTEGGGEARKGEGRHNSYCYRRAGTATENVR